MQDASRIAGELHMNERRTAQRPHKPMFEDFMAMVRAEFRANGRLVAHIFMAGMVAGALCATVGVLFASLL
jgi:hypothetical protein